MCPEVLYEHVIEVEERVVLQQESCQLGLDGEEIVGITGEKVCHRDEHHKSCIV